jgi:hypothetical protein
MVVRVFSHENGIAIKASVAASQVRIDHIVDTGDFGPDQGGLNFNFTTALRER